MSKDVFRKVSIERLSSPEQLDTLMKVTSLRGWLALTAVGLLLASAILWGFFGTLNTKVTTQGVLILPGGIQTVYSPASGEITDIRIVENDYIKKGDAIARVEQPHILQQIEQSMAMLEEAEAINTRQSTVELRNQIAKLNTTISALRLDYLNQSTVVSGYTGRVIEVKAKKDITVGQGTSIASIELGEAKAHDLVAVMYIPSQVGKKILPGMDVDISPSSVNREEHGFMIGRVTSVSEFPLTPQSMFLTLGNEALVNELARQGTSLLEVKVDLVPSSTTFSGYAWSTAAGPPQQIDSGTLAYGSITVKKQKPISLVIPQIK